jgi:hypothetical protein
MSCNCNGVDGVTTHSLVRDARLPSGRTLTYTPGPVRTTDARDAHSVDPPRHHRHPLYLLNIASIPEP